MQGSYQSILNFQKYLLLHLYCCYHCSILIIMILLVKVVGHVNIFVFFLLVVTLTVFILIFLVLVFLEGLCACFANWRQVRTLEMN